MSFRFDYTCGSIDGEGGGHGNGGGGQVDSGHPWKLYRAEVFLTAESLGDWVYVAEYLDKRNGNDKSFLLPIYRIDGEPAHDIIWEGADRTQRLEDQLALLFGIDQEADIPGLGFQQLAVINNFPFVEICLEDCDNPSVFPEQGISLTPLLIWALAPIAEKALGTNVNLLGETYFEWIYGEGKKVYFSGCSPVTQAMGLTAPHPGSIPWFELVEAGLAAGSEDVPTYQCLGSGASDICTRVLQDGEVLTQRLLTPDADCPTAERLELVSAGVIRAPAGLVISGSSGFNSVEIRPQSEDTPGSLIVDGLSNEDIFQSSCLFDRFARVICFARFRFFMAAEYGCGLSEEYAGGRSLLVHSEDSNVHLDNTRLGLSDGLFVPAARGLRLCNSQLFARDSAVSASEVALHSMRSNLALTADDDRFLDINGDLYGVLLNPDNQLYLHRTNLVGRRTLQLHDSEVSGSFVHLTPSSDMPGSQALRVFGESTISLRLSSARDYRCVGNVMTEDSALSFIFPTNDLVEDNEFLTCNIGPVTVVE